MFIESATIDSTAGDGVEVAFGGNAIAYHAGAEHDSGE